MKSISIPPQILVKLAICTMVLILLVLAAIIPQQRDVERKRLDIEESNHAMQRHNALMPTYAKMKVQLDKGLPTGIPDEREVHLTQDRITEISSILRELASDLGVMANAIVPDPSSIATGSNTISVDCSFQGPMEAQQNLLLELGALSCLAHIEQITIREDRAQANMQLKAWLTLE
ncbi:hypothetical protein [Desulfovibrio ferrophilus]|uniref:Transcriptional regulator, Crp/Fnr family n=1 Tax=Desulfovibrio ferrophilus TaxID=241368 RepID=A0A2Z6AZ24_9BACT|nr:hypothetical protein [Desulfovibrio ferrophilus]BBD08517.1 transcriptional regulator, Crp/Fnr family [Desulfovibrio ferrophilus]